MRRDRFLKAVKLTTKRYSAVQRLPLDCAPRTLKERCRGHSRKRSLPSLPKGRKRSLPMPPKAVRWRKPSHGISEGVPGGIHFDISVIDIRAVPGL